MFLLLLATILARCAPPPATDCKLTMVARMPLTVQDRLLVVPATIDGKEVNLVVDSGAERSTISEAVARRLALPPEPGYTTRALGVGGVTTTTDVRVRRLILGGVHFPLDRIAVGSFDLRTALGLNADGLLGADILLAFDLDIDVPGGKLTLYRRRICPGMRPPWTEPAIEIAGVRARRDRLLVPFQLDDVPGMAILDTGAQANVIGIDMARRMGLDQRTLANDPAVRQRGVGPTETISRLHQFRSLRIGPVTRYQPRITVMTSDFGVGDALIGEQFLQGRRVWLAFHSRQIFVSPASQPSVPAQRPSPASQQ
ncbi:retroviral-like aspartic protease family protein [Rhodopila sp.]|uniref:retroviral-like aspartic protease family protein n=1 Tax=Rhodopila sp. TaxID=2480087 RepID=UPI003D1356CB